MGFPSFFTPSLFQKLPSNKSLTLWAAKCKGIVQKPSKSPKSKEEERTKVAKTSEKWGNSLTMEGSI